MLLLVLFATVNLGAGSEADQAAELEVTHVSGTVILTTRAAMDALGFEEYDRGAVATLDLEVLSVTSTGCVDCIATPRGFQLQGGVVVRELIDEADRLGRIEAQINVTYLREYIEEDFIAREWLFVNWDAGDASFQMDLIIVHDPPRWEPADRYAAGFVSVEPGQESRTGPWILMTSLAGGDILSQGCLPDNFACDEATRPDIELTSTMGLAATAVEISHPPTWALVDGSLNGSLTPTGMEDMRSLFEVGEPVDTISPFCPHTDDEILAAQTWTASDVDGLSISPIGLWLGAVGLPSTEFTSTAGTWTEVEFEQTSCGALLDVNGAFRVGISTT